MKAAIFSVFTTLAVTSAANAVAVGLEWAGNIATPHTFPMGPNTPMTLRFYIQNGVSSPAQAPVTQAIGVVLNAWEDAACTIPADDTWFQVSARALIPGWSVAPANNNADLNGLQFAAIAGSNWTVPQGKNYVMDITLKYLSFAAPRYYLTMNRAASAIIDNTGADYMTNDAIWYDTNFATSGKARWGFGNWGGGAWSRYDPSSQSYIGQTPNPLFVTPEPASLALFIVGAASVVRRR